MAAGTPEGLGTSTSAGRPEGLRYEWRGGLLRDSSSISAETFS